MIVSISNLALVFFLAVAWLREAGPLWAGLILRELRWPRGLRAIGIG